MPGADVDMRHTEHAEKGMDNLHGILRYREHALVVLRQQPHSCALKPLVSVAVTEFLQQALMSFAPRG